MRAKSLLVLTLPLLACAAAPAQAGPLAETLADTWACTALEFGSDLAMTVSYRRSDDFLIGEIKEDDGAALVEVWLSDGQAELSLRRILSSDSTIEMTLAEEAPTSMKLEGEMRLRIGTTAKVREEFSFTGSEEFHAVWEADNGGGWLPVLDRTCKRI